MAPVAISSLNGDFPPHTRKVVPAAAMPLPTPPATAISSALSAPETAEPHAPITLASPLSNPRVGTDVPPRRPSPWHDLAHSLSATATPTRSSSMSMTIPGSPQLHHHPSPGDTSSPAETPLSTSQALREWDLRLSLPSGSFSRHTLIPPPSPTTPNSPSPPLELIPKLVPESDKHGHIEYKLKLINPSAERFERLVTQMMWRLKQGRNEAIYELGLADDGTVVGLSRSDMDASLRTLELMASEVGATVLVLKEIVLAKSVYPRSATNVSSANGVTDRNLNVRDDSPAGWVVPRRPSWMTSSVDAAEGEEHPPRGKAKKVKKKKSWKRRDRRALWGVAMGNEGEDGGGASKERQIVFDLSMGGGEDSEDDDEGSFEIGRSIDGSRGEAGGWDEERRTRKVSSSSIASNVSDVSGTSHTSESSYRRRSDEDVPQFHLDLEDTAAPDDDNRLPPMFPPYSLEHAGPKRRRWKKPPPAKLSEKKPSATSAAKARKASQRREARRLSLLRGDGMGEGFDFGDEVEDGENGAGEIARGSSLKLSAPVAGSAPMPMGSDGSTGCVSAASVDGISENGRSMNGGAADKYKQEEETAEADEEEDESAMIQNLLSLPLDSLSLSFADVRTVHARTPSPSSSSSTEYAPSRRDVEVDGDINPAPGQGGGMAEYEGPGGRRGCAEERICVEALVVRKVLHEEEEDGWGWGGEDDGWGLSGELDGDGDGDEAVTSVMNASSDGGVDQAASHNFGGFGSRAKNLGQENEGDIRGRGMEEQCEDENKDDPWGFG